MAVIRGPSVCRWFENCAENRKRYRANERGMHARQEGRSYLLYYGSWYYRGISRAREVAEEFSFGISIDAISREEERRKIRASRNWIPAIFRELNVITCVLHLIKRNEGDVVLPQCTIEPLPAALFYRVYNPNAPIRI